MRPDQRKRQRPATSAAAINVLADKSLVLARHPVSRETEQRLDALVELVRKWQAHINLIAPSTLPTIWSRHIADGLALADLAPERRVWADLGSGGGFPGLVVAIVRREQPNFSITLVESNGKKAAFLRSAAQELDLPVKVRAARIEESQEVLRQAEAVSARALASLDVLFRLVAPSLQSDARCYFAKGRNHEGEIAEATARWRFDLVKHDPMTDEGSTILEISNLSRNGASA